MRAKHLCLFLAALACATSVWAAPAIAAPADSGIIAPGAALEKLAGGFAFSEGPACDAAGNVFFTDQPNNAILEWSVDNTLTTFSAPCGRSNGLCFDKAGNLWACADEKNQLWCFAPDGKSHTVMIKEFGGKLLNGPNDLWIRPDGGIYMTDPLCPRDYWVGRDKNTMQQDGKYVYYVDPISLKNPKTVSIRRVTEAFGFPNGIIGTPDGKTLYVADLGKGKTWAYDIQADGSLNNKRQFCSMGSDGMTIDEQGNVYLTGRGVSVFNPQGKQIEHIDIAERWTGNVCFGGRDHKTLFITASTGLYAMKMAVKGAGSQ